MRPIYLTESAIKHFKPFISTRGVIGIKFGVTDAGCSGHSYTIEAITDYNPTDYVVEGEVNVYVAEEQMRYLFGTEIDYVKDGINWVLKYNNPNAESECGCGETFAVNETPAYEIDSTLFSQS